MGAGDSKSKAASPEKGTAPTAPEPATAPTPAVPEAKAPAPTPAPTPAAKETPKTAEKPTPAEGAASIAAAKKEEEPKESKPKGEAKPKGESKAKSKPKAKPKEKKEGEKIEKSEFQCCVRNLSEDATEEQLKTLFAPFGTVGTINMITKPDGKCRGLAFVTLGSAEEVAKAIAEMDKKSVDGKEISVAIAERKQKAGDDSKAAKGKSKGKEKGDKVASEKGKGKGKKGEDNRRPSQQVGYVPPSAYGQQPMYGYQYPYPYGQYGYGTSPQMQAAQLAQMQYMAQSMYAAQVAAAGMGSPKASAVPPGPIMPTVDTTEYTGTLKSLSKRNGYGFIDWNENNKNKWYVHDDPENKKGMRGVPRNVYIAAELLPENCALGTPLKFTVALNTKGHPQARTCQAA
jgi:RNA recognition motif-containing protein